MPDGKIVPKLKVSDAIKQVLQTRQKVESQELLARLALKILRRENKNYSLTPIRVKRIALEIPDIEVKAKTKKVSKYKLKNCPICESKILPLTVKNLLNKETVIGHQCSKCGYQSDLEAFVPMKYSFLWKV